MADKMSGAFSSFQETEVPGAGCPGCTSIHFFRMHARRGLVLLLFLIVMASVGCARHRPVLSVPVQRPVQESEAERVPCQWPVNCPAQRISSRFGEKRSGGRVHKGLDIAAPQGTPVRATASGITSFSGEQSGYGKIVVVDHCNGYETAYAHLDAILTSRGTKVMRGAKIGLVGATGNATGPHLHYEVRCNKKYVDPEIYLP